MTETETKVLGRIISASFGFGGYQDTRLGLTVRVGNRSSDWGDFLSPERAGEILEKARIKATDKLVGTPVEITVDGGSVLKSWRVLEEVL